MEIHVSEDANTLTIAVGGSLNTNTAPELEQAVETAFSTGTSYQEVVFDFSNLDYISSAGLRVLMVAYKRAQSTGAGMNLIGASDDVQEVLDITGFSELFER